jgi:choline kinase
MRAIILAAGRGRRLAPMGWTRPKCLLEVAGRTLLDHTISALIEHGITDIVMVVGYHRELVIDALRQHPVMPRFIVNHNFADTNTIHSLWLAHQYIDDDFLYFNADVLFDPELLTRLLGRHGSVLAVELKRCGREDVKVILDAQSRICAIGKDLNPDDCAGEFIGVARFDRAISSDFCAMLRHCNEGLNQRHLFFEAALNDLLNDHIVTALPLDTLRAIEIDIPDDFQRAKRLFEAPKG